MPVDELALKKALANQISPARKAVSMPPMVLGGSQPEMRTYNPSLGEMLAGAISQGADKIGLGGISNRLGQEGRMLAEMVPGVGDAIDANEMGRAASRGDYLSAALSGAALALPVVGGSMLKKADEPVKKGIKAYHGSPHDFDRFSLDKIGTGEGAQAYGHGLYFADSEDVAQNYRQALQQVDLGPFDEIGIPPKDWNAARMFAQTMDMSQPEAAARDFAQWTGRDVSPELVDAFKRAKKPGRMYEVNINANPDDFLDYDRSLVDQGAAAQEALKKLGYVADPQGLNNYDSALLDALIGDAGAPLPARPRNPTGSDILSQVGESRLKEAGIPGIKYLDGMSRSAGEGSRNYVVFDDALIEIVRKYGLAGAVAAGVISEEMARQMQEQGAI